jgi:hypothetical protein
MRIELIGNPEALLRTLRRVDAANASFFKHRHRTAVTVPPFFAVRVDPQGAVTPRARPAHSEPIAMPPRTRAVPAQGD